MTERQRHVLSLRRTDINAALRRFSENEAIYSACMNAFLYDQTVEHLNESIEKGLWDDAFTAAHALKGVAGNMGFIPLMHDTGQLIVLIRGGRTSEIRQALEKVNSSYRDIVDGINQYFVLEGEKSKGDSL